MKKKWWLIVLVLILAGVGYGGYTLYRQITAQQSAAAAAATLEQETVIVERGTLRVTVEAGGSLAPDRELAVAFATGGKVTEVLVEVGDVVKAGDILARLDDTDARQSLADAALQVRQAEISLALTQVEAKAGLAQANLEAAQADYERTVTNNAHTGDQLTSARINLKQAQEALQDAQETYDTAWSPDRDWELGDPRRSSRLENEREAATRALEKAKDSLMMAQASYNLAVIGIDKSATQDADIKVLNAQITLDKEPIQLEQSQLSLEQARFKLATAQRNLEETVLTAPIDGVVTALNVQTGEWAAGNQAAMVLSDLTTLVVDIGLDESDVAHISLGQEALVTLDAFDDVELTGKITAIAPTANTQAGVVLYPVTITLDPTDVPIRAGMTADVEIVTDSAADVLIAPVKAIRSIDGQHFVLRKLRAGEEALAAPGGTLPGGQMPQGALPSQNMSAEQRQQFLTQQQQMTAGFILAPVELGLITDTYAEIHSGLEEGDVVSVSSTQATNNGTGSGMSFPGAGFMGGGRP